MNNNKILELIINDIIPNNKKYKKEGILCSIIKNEIEIIYNNHKYIIYSSKNKLHILENKKLIKTFFMDTNFNKIIDYIKNIH